MEVTIPVARARARANSSLCGSETSNSGNSKSNDQLMMNNMNIAMMSDSQFSDSLDALLDNFSSETTTPTTPTPTLPTPPPLEVASCAATIGGGIGTSISSNSNAMKASSAEETAALLGRLQQAGALASQPQGSNSQNPYCLAQPVGVLAALMPPYQGIPFAAPSSPQHSAFSLPTMLASYGPNTNTNLPGQQHQPVLQPGMTSFQTGAPNYTQAQTLKNPSFDATEAQAPAHKLEASTSSTFISSMSCPSEDNNNPKKRSTRDCFAISEDEGDLKKRKKDRNAREQQRAQQVTDQIAHLRTVLEQSNVPLSKTDKFSTLVTVEEYIVQLQNKSASLAAEHQNLLTSLQQTTELVNNQYSAPPSVTDSGSETCPSEHEEEGSAQFVKGINYKWIFDCCPFAFAIAAIDGRFMDCNKEFEELTAYTRAELLPMELQDINKEPTLSSSEDNKAVDAAATKKSKKKKHNMSIFNILNREHIESFFGPMSKILQYDGDDAETKDDLNEDDDKDTFSRDIQLCKRSNRKATMRVTLVRSPTGLPRFFNCVLIPTDELPSIS